MERFDPSNKTSDCFHYTLVRYQWINPNNKTCLHRWCSNKIYDNDKVYYAIFCDVPLGLSKML